MMGEQRALRKALLGGRKLKCNHRIGRQTLSHAKKQLCLRTQPAVICGGSQSSIPVFLTL